MNVEERESEARRHVEIVRDWQERRERAWESTAMLRQQKDIIYKNFGRWVMVTGTSCMTVILPKELQECVDYIDKCIGKAMLIDNTSLLFLQDEIGKGNPVCASI
jgi:hypothetical protein